MFPSSTNSSTLSESACSVLDKPPKSPDCRLETAPSLPQADCKRCALRRGAFRWGAGAVCDEAFFADRFFLAGPFGRIACLLRNAFFARFAGAIFDFVRLRLLFFLEGMAAVYHHVSRRPQRPQHQELFEHSPGISSTMRYQRLLRRGRRT